MDIALQQDTPTTDEQVKARFMAWLEEGHREMAWNLYQVRRLQDQSVLRAWTCTLYSVVGEVAPSWAEEL